MTPEFFDFFEFCDVIGLTSAPILAELVELHSLSICSSGVGSGDELELGDDFQVKEDSELGGEFEILEEFEVSGHFHIGEEFELGGEFQEGTGENT